MLCDVIAGAIIKRKSQGAHYGVVVLAEGLIEAIGEEELTRVLGDRLPRYGKLRRDEFGHLKLGDIEFGRLIIDLLSERLEELQVTTRFIYKVLGYELRCADPIPFDAEYTRDLGYGAVKYLRSDEAGRSGAVISFDEGAMKPLPFGELINPATKRFPTRFVDVHGETYECACRYMIRLEKGDFENARQLAELADECGLTPEQFRARFGKVVGLP